MLVVSGDLPLLTVAAVEDFVAQAAAAEADFAYPIIPKEVCEARFPGGKRTYVRLRDGTFTGGNAVAVTRDFTTRRRALITGIYTARKSPVKLASFFGLGFIIGVASGRLSISQIEARASRIIGGRAKAIISRHAELGFDVDKLADLEVARRAAAG